MKRILLMDDSEVFLDVTRAALEARGYQVQCARDLAQLERARAGDADLVLMDVHMPEAFGDDVAMVLRDAGGSAPIYLLSSIDEVELAERVAWARIDGYISKTDGLAALVARVEAIIPIAPVDP